MSDNENTQAGAGENNGGSEDWQKKYQDADERAKRFEGKLTDLEKQLEGFKGIDLDKLKADSEALSNLQKQGALNGSDEDRAAYLDQKIAEARAEDQKRLDALRDENKLYKSQIHQYQVVNEVMKGIGSMITEGAEEDIQRLVTESFGIDESGIFVKDKDGKPAMFEGNTRKTPQQWAEDLKQRKPFYFRSTKQSGTHENHTSSGGITVEQYLAMTKDQRDKLPKSVHDEMVPAVLNRQMGFGN